MYPQTHDNTMRKESSISDMNALRKNLGFTLIEVLISASIVILLLIGLAQLTIHSLLVKRLSDYRMNSAELASSKLEYFKSLRFESDNLKQGCDEESVKGASLNTAYHREWEIQEISSSMKKIELECFCEHNPKRKIRLILFICKELGF
jgi:Tfp pilus assembly protein PilV